MGDKFSSFEALKRHYKSRDFRVRWVNRQASVTVLSIHGGFLEPGTSAIAAGITGRDHNLFDFQCLRCDLGLEMHITSTLFRHPRASEMLAVSRAAISIHGMGSQGKPTIWLGGSNWHFKGIVLAALSKQGFDVDPDCPRYRGEDKRNIVNLAAEHGVQLEISDELMAQLFSVLAFRCDRRPLPTTERFTLLIAAMRAAILLYLT